MFGRITRSLVVGAAITLAAAIGPGAIPAMADQCLNQSDTRDAVQNGRAVEFSNFFSRLRGQVQEVYGAALCNAGGRLVYEAQVRVNGVTKTVTLDALSGAPY